MDDLMNGNRFASRQLIVHRNQPGQQPMLLLESKYWQFSPTVWRCDGKEGENQNVFIRDGSFSFEASSCSETNGFHFGKLGLDRGVRSEVTASILTRKNLLLTATHIFDVDLVKFLSAPTLVFWTRK